MANILIASPHETERSRLVKSLVSDGHTFVLCPDGRSVSEEIKRALPDLVIADVDLPGMDAFEMVRILEEMGGEQGVPLIVGHAGLQEEEEEEEVQEGSAFTWMGLSAEPEDLRQMVRARLEAGKVHQQGRLLVVDDDFNIREPLAKRLRIKGYEVITALDGEEGLQRLEESPDLVLTDIAMPKLDGFGLLERMRAEPRFREIPVIVMTAHARGPDDAARGMELGANDYVRKPFEWTELFARVQTQLRIREAHWLMVEKQRDLAIIELAGAAAHEINNPLAVVMARLELILSRMDRSDRFYQDIEKIDNLVCRIAGVVEKMSQVRRYQVQHYCGGINILDLDGASAPDDSAPEP